MKPQLIKDSTCFLIGIGILIFFGALAQSTPSFAQSGTNSAVLTLYRKHPMDPLPGNGIRTGYSFGTESKDELREKVCSGEKYEFDRYSSYCAADPGFIPFPGIPSLSCKEFLTAKRHAYEECRSPSNSIVCTGRGFWAIARSARSGEVLPDGSIGNTGEGEAVGGAACGKTEKSAIGAALASCEKTRAQKGIGDAKCYPYRWSELK